MSEQDKRELNKNLTTAKRIKKTIRIRRHFDLAKNLAFQASYGKIRHGAVLVKGGSAINGAFNKEKYSSFGSRFRHKECGHATVHAEIGCVLGLARDKTQGTTLYVIRINRRGEFRLSKPCCMCHEVLKHVGVKKVIYSTSDNGAETYRL